MRQQLPIAEAKAGFAECIRRAERGETIVLTRHGRPVARITGLGPPTAATERGGEVRESEAAYGAPSRLGPSAESRRERLEHLLREEIWPLVPDELLDRGLDKAEREEILGYGGRGV